MQKKGVLLAVSSLPGKYGVGDFGKEAKDFIKILAKNKMNIWQILPLNPIGYGHSPYQPFSSYAFDEIYISLEDLKKRELISEYKGLPQKDKSDYEEARKIKEKAIYHAYEKFSKNKENMAKLEKFIKDNPYVTEFSKFITLKEFNNSVSWDNWTVFEKDRPGDYEYNYHKHAFAQMIMSEEWNDIRKFANKNGIEIMGDVPFYVGYDSSDVYYHKECYYLDDHDKPTCIAGVPPDYFSEDGQRWGNPIFNWEHLYETKFKTLVDRIGFASTFFDIIRIDHFRAFDSYWAIVPTCPTAREGEWRYPDGYGFFRRLYEVYPNINIVVEDLGDLRPEVLQLRDYFNLPGMREIEFTIFEDEIQNRHFEKENMLYYTSTHDNETLNEWCENRTEEERNQLNWRFGELGLPGNNLVEKLIHYALRRKENYIIINASDILNVDRTHRMNIPGIINDVNWTFKLTELKTFDKELGRILNE